MKDQKQVTVRIYGRSYTMLTNENEEYTDKLCNALNNRMDELRQQKRSISIQDAAAVISLECLDELVKNKKTEQNIRTQISAYAEDAAESRAEAEKLRKEVERLTKKTEQLEREVKLRMQFKADDGSAPKIEDRSVSDILEAVSAKKK